MLESIPGIEFYERVPDKIGKFCFLNVTQRNLIVLDDLMAQVGKDYRVADYLQKKPSHELVGDLYRAIAKYIPPRKTDAKHQFKRPLHCFVQVS